MDLVKRAIKRVISSPLFGIKKLQFAHAVIHSMFMPGFIKKTVIRYRKYFPKPTLLIGFDYDSQTSGKLLLDLRSYCDREIFFAQFEPATLRFYAALLDRCRYKCVWDIGSNIGFYTVLAGLKIGQQGSVYAFEPMSKAFARLKKNVELNGLRNVKLFNVALAQTNGLKEIYALDVEHVTSSPTLNREWADKNSFIVKGKIVTRNALSLLNSGELEKPDMIKIDAETLEPEILGTIKNVLKGPDAPDIICELMPPGIEALTKLLLVECRYQSFHITLEGVRKVEALKMRRPYNDYFFTKKPGFGL